MPGRDVRDAVGVHRPVHLDHRHPVPPRGADGVIGDQPVPRHPVALRESSTERPAAQARPPFGITDLRGDRTGT